MKKYKHDYENLGKKVYRKIHGLFYRIVKNKEKAYIFYRSYRHRNKKPQTENKVAQYMSQEPNYSAGFGHGIDVWRNGIINADLFRLEYVYTPMVSKAWEDALGFGENEKAAEELKKNGYKEVLLPYYDPSDEKSIQIIKKIIESYKGKKVIFRNEFEQISRRDQFMIGAEYMRRKFWAASKRKTDELIYRKEEVSVAIHIRRGDVKEGIANGNEKYKMRWLDEEYYINIIEMIHSSSEEKDRTHYYIFSEGNKDDFILLNKLEMNIEFCLDMSAIDSFIHMCRADLLVVGLSSFSYDPGLINPALKIVPNRLWNPYPDNEEWIVADKDGFISEKDKKKVADVISQHGKN